MGIGTDFKGSTRERLKKITQQLKMIDYENNYSGDKHDFVSTFNRFHLQYDEIFAQQGLILDLKVKEGIANHKSIEEQKYFLRVLTETGFEIGGVELKTGGPMSAGEHSLRLINRVDDDVVKEQKYMYNTYIIHLSLAIIEKIFSIMYQNNVITEREAIIVVNALIKWEIVDQIGAEIAKETSLYGYFDKHRKSVYLYVGKECYEKEKKILLTNDAIMSVRYSDLGDIEVEDIKYRPILSVSYPLRVQLNRNQSKIRIAFNYRNGCYTWQSEADGTICGEISIEKMMTPEDVIASWQEIYEELAIAEIIGVTKTYTDLFRGFDKTDMSGEEFKKATSKLFKEIRYLFKGEDEAVIIQELKKNEEASFVKDNNFLNGKISVYHFDQSGSSVDLRIEYGVLRAKILGTDIGVFREKIGDSITYFAKKLDYFDADFAESKMNEYKNAMP